MTVTANTTRNDYEGNGQSVYPFTFQLKDASDLAVYLNGYLQTLNTNYVVENTSSSQYITFTLYSDGVRIHPQETDSIAIVMEMDLDRDTNYQSSGAFLSSEVNNDFDRLWLATNQQQTRINRSIHLSNVEPARDMFLPIISQRANKILAFDANGNVTTSTGDYNTWNTAYNNMITSASFSGGNYTLTQQDGGTISTSLDGRYLPLSGGTVTGILNVNSTGGLTFDAGALTIASASGASLIRETGSGDLSIEAGNLNLKPNANETYISCVADGAVTLHYDNAPKLATTNTGISVTGTLSATGYNDSNWNTAYSWGNHASAGYLATSGGTMSGDIDFGSNKAKFVGLEIYNTIGNTSVIEETGSGNLNIKGADVRIQTPANEDIIKGEADGAVTLYYNNSPKLATTNTGVSVTGTLSATGYNDSNWNDAYSNKITAVNYSGSTLTLTQQDGGTLTTTINASGGGGGTATGVDLADNVIATFGNSDDLQIYHDGSNSHIKDAGSGGLRLSTNQFRVYNAATDELSISAVENSSVELYFDNDKKIETTSSGINVTGTRINLTGSGTTVKALIEATDGSQAGLDLKNSEGWFRLISDGGELSVYDQTDNTERFRIDTDGNVGIGTTNPARKLTVQGGSGDNLPVRIVGGSGTTKSHMEFQDASTTADYKVTLGSVGDGMSFQAGGSERLRIDSSGNLLVGKTSQAYATAGLELEGAGRVVATRDGASAGIFARLNSDGDIVNFRKGGTTVGSIGTRANYIKIGNGDTNLLFNSASDAVTPEGASANRDASIDLGRNVSRFKDLYLSGSIHGDTVFKNNAGTTEYARFNSSGWLGLGDSSPSAKLHVQSTSTASGCSVTQNTSAFFDAQTGNYIGIGGGSTSTLGINFGDSSDADSGRILYRNSLDQMAFYTLANERMTIDQSGNVGVNVTTPLARMHLTKYGSSSGVAPNAGSALFLDDASSTVLQMGAAWYGASSILFGRGASSSTSADNDIGSIYYSNYFNFLSFKVNGSDRMQINSSGNLGINTTSPTEKLDVNSDKIRLRNSNTPSSATSTGNKGEICYDSNYVYICVATNTWKRAALASW